MAEALTTSQETKLVLGPFVGDITASSVKLWLNVDAEAGDREVFVTLKLVKQGPVRLHEPGSGVIADKKDIEIPELENPVVTYGEIRCLKSDLGTGIITLPDLKPNSKYYYQLWQDKARSIELDLNPHKKDGPSDSKEVLRPEDLFFWTLPEDGYGRQLDFLLMSCHNPQTATSDGFKGFGVWRQIPNIMKENANVRFAILAGDQVYADEVEAEVLNENDPLKRLQLYLKVYKKFWENEHYRRVLCRIPAVLMWDDHDITDGWGSREDSFKSKSSAEFKPEWNELFGTAKQMFKVMQASRNPDPLSADFSGGFDSCFIVGKAGFVLADLRSNRNIRGGQTTEDGRIWDPAQLAAIKNWMATNRKELHTLFFVSSVVFSHGAPSVEKYILRIWFRVIDAVNLLGRFYIFKKPLRVFNDKVGDLRDDINDSWGSDANKHEAERALDFLFELENPSDGENPLNVVILSGDIHTPGYSTIYSSREAHREKAVIPHIVATPVAYEPFSWVGEAIFRHLTKVVALGTSGTYTSQVSHHFCYRNVVVVSLRNYEADESHLKVKYYLEGFPEPQVMLFDLNHGAHRENIRWRAVKNPKLSSKLVSWITRKPIPVSFVDELPPASAELPLPEKPMD